MPAAVRWRCGSRLAEAPIGSPCRGFSGGQTYCRRSISGADLQQLVAADFLGLISSMIHKFVRMERDICTREHVYVFIDVADRSVARDLGTYLMAAVPKATIIGFTGTPVDRTAQGQ